MFPHRFSILPIDRTLSGTPTSGQNRPGGNGNKWVLHIPEISQARASTSNGLMILAGHSLGKGSYPLFRDTVGVFYSHNQLG